jgi:hypothetical protein
VSLDPLLHHFVRWRRASRQWQGATQGVAGILLLCVVLVLARLTFKQRSHSKPATQPVSVSDATGWAVPLLAVSVALGFVVMALIQMFKPALRAYVHRQEIRRWIRSGGHRSSNVNRFLNRVSFNQPAALVELPIEQLAAQIQAAAEAALASPEAFGPLLQQVAGREADLGNVKVRTSDVDASGAGSAVGTNASQLRGDSEEELNRRSKASYLIHRRIDALQIQVRHRWRGLLRMLSLAGSLLVAATVTAVLDLWRESPVGTALSVLLLSLLGAFFASVARDMTAIIERLRN